MGLKKNRSNTRSSSIQAGFFFIMIACSVMLHASTRVASAAAAWVPTFAAGSYCCRGSAVTAGCLMKNNHRLESSSSPLLRHLSSSRSSNIEVDEEGRRIRKRQQSSIQQGNDDGGGWDDFDVTSTTRSSSSSDGDYGGGGGWDDFNPFDDSARKTGPSRSNSKARNSSRDRGGGGKARSRRNESPSYYSGGRAARATNSRQTKDKGAQDRKINLKALEGAGFVHLYGLSSCLNALKANRRDFTRPEDMIDLEDLSGQDYEHEMMQRERKPEAQYSPWLFVQQKQGGSSGKRSQDKTLAAQELQELAQERNIPIATVDKGVLNTLCHNRPHQGFVLRCGKMTFEPLSRIPLPDNDEDAPNLWLVLDEVVDPQNLGALLRSAYFMGNVGVLVTAKNSAPPSPVVSAASAGALELLKVYATSNLPRTLQQANDDGFLILGAAASAPSNSNMVVHDLQNLQINKDKPIILVLGSEGHGLRNLVLKACTDLVRIPPIGGHEQPEGVDSLNVSVTGGILLWHLLQAMR